MVSTIGKLAIASVAAAGLGGGVCLSSSSRNRNSWGQDHEKYLISIKEAGGYSYMSDKSKFGGKYYYYFLSTEDNRNKSFWDENAKELNKDSEKLSRDGFFKDNEGKWTGDLLKSKCKEQYDKTNFKNSEEKWKEVWIYCSLMKNKPTTVSETNYTVDKNYSSNSFGGKLKGSIVSIEDYDNLQFWGLKDLAFKDGAFYKEGDSNFFNKKNLNKDIKTFCSEAYKKDVSSDSPKEDEVKRHCSLD